MPGTRSGTILRRVLGRFACLLLVASWGFPLTPARGEAQSRGVRPPAVAGIFYPADPQALRERIEDLLAGAPDDAVQQAAALRAGIVPHAGLEYSGGVAARFYQAVRGRSYEAVVVVSASHQEAFPGVSIWPGGSLSTPLGDIAIDRSLAEQLVAADDSIRFATPGYGAEHTLEVQLPFLQVALPGVPVVPLMVGRQSFGLSYRLARTLATVFKGRNVLLLASSDLSHYHDAATAARLDAEALELVRSNDSFLLGYLGFTGEVEACGIGAVVAVLEAARLLGAGRTQVLAYAHSGGVTGDSTSVVGYSAVAVSEGSAGPQALTPEEKQLLLQIARDNVAAVVRGEPPPPMPGLTPALMRKQAAFVTLRIGGELRGCVGGIVALQPLAQQVRDAAIAASQDRRFPPLSAAELQRLEYEISLLTPLTPLDDPESLVVGRDGVVLVQGDRRGVLLPSVAIEQGWDREEFLEQVGLKAGLSRRAWRQPGTQILAFQTESVR